MIITQSSRIITSNDLADVSVEALNQLFFRAEGRYRSTEKITLALNHSLVCISARMLRDNSLVGFVRLGGDGVFQASIWDFVVDPTLVNPESSKRLILQRLKREVKQRFPRCCISIFSTLENQALFEEVGFKEDAHGIRAMGLPIDNSSVNYRP